MNIAGAFSKYSTIIKYLKFLKQYRINVYDSDYKCSWNGGRCNKEVCLPDIEKLIKFYNKLGIGVYFTFSNFEIDLSDQLGNYYLKLLNTCNFNGVILSNKDFYEYLRTNYKNLTLVKSCTYRYKEDLFSKDYDRIVLKLEDCDIVKDFDRYELLINDDCVQNCKYAEEHYKSIALFNNHKIDSEFKCPFHKPQRKPNLEILKKFSNFKICGRDDSDEVFENTLKNSIRLLNEAFF